MAKYSTNTVEGERLDISVKWFLARKVKKKEKKKSLWTCKYSAPMHLLTRTQTLTSASVSTSWRERPPVSRECVER